MLRPHKGDKPNRDVLCCPAGLGRYVLVVLVELVVVLVVDGSSCGAGNKGTTDRRGLKRKTDGHLQHEMDNKQEKTKMSPEVEDVFFPAPSWFNHILGDSPIGRYQLSITLDPHWIITY
ncbi:unnamed protein product [Pleuronectes platessa]|uniref:Uncharacterized protein n=1 Tax=Pleuronectes platessa TaxID=8262 RepID=A0A9N7UK98_PLEPL|nr:unnamed protein product [Pleuronectes platessa]